MRLIHLVLFLSSLIGSAQQEESRNYPLGPIGGQFRVTPGSNAARVVSVVSGAPGQTAGLAAGDYIYGAFGKPFTPTGSMHYGFTQDLGLAVDRAEAADGVLPLLVLRPGTGGITLNVQLPAAGAFGPVYPINSPKFNGMYEAAVAHLHQQAMNANGNLGYFTGWTGLCLLGHPDWNQTTGARPYRQSVNKVRDYVVSQLNSANYSPNENKIILADGTVADNPNHQGGISNWQLGQMVMFLSEYYVKTADASVAATLQRGAELCANSVQWWKQPALAGNGYSPEHNHVKGMVSHGGVTGDYIHLGWGGGINMCGVYSFNGLAFARRAGMNMAARPRDGHDFGYDPYPDTLMPVVPANLKGYKHTLEEKFMYQWDFMGRRSMTRSNGAWGDGHIWYLAGQGSTTWDAGGRTPGTLLGIAMFQADVGNLNADDQDRVERMKGYISRAYMWQQEAHAYCVGAQAYQALAAPYLSDRQLRYFMDNWRFYFALSRTHTAGFQYVRARSTNDSYLDETRCAAINVALPHAIANGRFSLVPGYNTERLVVAFDHPEMTWPAIEARALKSGSQSVPVPFRVLNGRGEPVDPAQYTATWTKTGGSGVVSFGEQTTFSDQPLTVFNQNHPPDSTALPSTGHGNYRGFSLRPNDTAFTVNGGSITAPDLILSSLTLRRSATAGSNSSNAVYLKIYTSQTPGTATWVGDSTNTGNLSGGNSEANVTFDFASLPINAGSTYYFYFANTPGNLASSAITWNTGRLRVSNDAGHTYSSGNLINTTWGSADTAFDAIFSAGIQMRTYSSPATPNDTLTFAADNTYRVQLTVTQGNRTIVEPIDLAVATTPENPPVPMSITAHPQTASANPGGSVTLTISTTGPTPALYQWRRNGVAIGAASTSRSLTLSNVSGGAEGDYDCVFTTELGTLTSNTARVTINGIGAVATGGLWREVYTGIDGSSVANLTGSAKFPFFADSSGVIPSAASPSNFADNFGERWTGWIRPSVSGNYRFYLASDDDSELWLSTSEMPADAVRILTLSGYTGEKQWSARSPSAYIPLVAGVRYAIEVRHKEGGGGDHCALAWQRQGNAAPVNGSGEIPGSVLEHRVGGLYVDTVFTRENQPPVFASDPLVLPAAAALVAYTGGSLATHASDPDEGDVLSFSKLTGPAWLTVASNGTLGGTPTSANAGENTFTVRVTDVSGGSATTTLLIEVTGANFHFDLNGSLAGSGAANGGNWNSGSIWSSDPLGTSSTFSWVDGASALFSAGDDANNIYQINLDGVKTVGGFVARTGEPQLSGGGLTPAAADTPFSVLTAAARIASPISGGARGIVKTGSGTLTLAGNNTFTGNLDITHGILQLAAGARLYNGGYTNTPVITVRNSATWRLPDFSYGGVGQLADYRQRRVLDGGTIEVTGSTHSSGQDFTVTQNGGVFRYSATGQTLTLSGNNNTNIHTLGTLTFDTVGTISVSGASAIIEGDGGLTKSGIGTLVLSANNTYSGTTTVAGGTLSLSGSIASATTVMPGATLAGSGTVNGAVIAESDSAIAPNAGAVLTTGTLALQQGAILRAAAGGRVHAVGNIGISNASLQVPAASGTDPILLVSYTGNRNGAFDPAASDLPEAWEIKYDDAARTIHLAPVPAGPAGFDAWIGAHETGGIDGFSEDADGDGIANGIEFVLHGGHPLVPNSAALPKIGQNSLGVQHFTFLRSARARGNTLIVVELSDDLLTWPAERRLAVGETTASSDPGVVITAHDEYDEVFVTLPPAAAKLFVRLSVTNP
jgi:autotransporter-associated beta strand protein